MTIKQSESKTERQRFTTTAMQHAVENRPQVDGDSKNYELAREFVVTFKKMYPDGTFDVNVVMDWSVSLGDLMFNDADKEFEAPPAFLNAYALGKFLKNNQERLGIKKTGSYGNRAVYSVWNSGEEENG